MFWRKNNHNILALAEMLDLDSNRWYYLNPMLQGDYSCSSIVDNCKILIAGFQSECIMEYWTSAKTFFYNSYFKFAPNQRKIMIESQNYIYLIECNAFMYSKQKYPSRNWEPILNMCHQDPLNSNIERIRSSNINLEPDQVYFSYNKGAICIGCFSYSWFFGYSESVNYYQFNMKSKLINKL